ncbi:MAG: LD-carboxypeptidase, partial [Bacteroidota bacterium]
ESWRVGELEGRRVGRPPLYLSIQSVVCYNPIMVLSNLAIINHIAMNRRKFNQNLSLGVFGSALLPGCKVEGQETAPPFPKPNKLIKPRRLKTGDTIGLITPGSFIPDKALEKAIGNVKKLGFKVKQGKHLRALRGYNAGTDAQRLEDLHTMFEDETVDAIWCARGGYGCTRILPMIDYDLISKKPKALIGYSDITALHNALLQKCNLVSFHAPVASSTMTDYASQQFKSVLMEPQANYTINLSQKNKAIKDELYQPKTIVGGKIQGQLIGGNLSLLAAMAGTEFEIDAANKIVFMEDIEEKPYRIDRMLTQLRQSSNLSQAAGFALGIFADCVPEPEDRSLSLIEAVEDRLKDLNKPTAYGLSWGHISNQATLPVGVNVELDADRFTLTLLESGVVM